MDAVGFGYFGSSNEGRNVEVALCGCGRADAHGFVGEFDVQAVFVGFGMDGDGGDAHFTAGSQDAQGDFAPVGDQYFFSMIIFPDGSDGLSGRLMRCGFFGRFCIGSRRKPTTWLPVSSQPAYIAESDR